MPAKKDKKEKKVKAEEKEEVEEEGGASDAEVEPEKPPPKSKSVFAAAADSDDDDEEEDESSKKKKSKSKASGEEDLSAMFGDAKKKKKKAKDDKKDAEEEQEKEKEKEKDKDKEKKKKKEKKPTPLVCEIAEVSPIPKKDKLRLCKVRIADGGDLLDVVTNAPNVAAGKRFLVALPGVTTANGVEVKQAKVGGVESSGMFCGPQELGWDTDTLDAAQAVMLADTVDLGGPPPSYEEALQMHQDRLAKEKAEVEAKAKKGKKGKADKKEEEDLDALLEEFNVETTADTSAKGKKGKKGKSEKKAEEDDEFEAALNEFKDAPKDAPAKAEPAAPPADPAPAKEEEVVDAKTLANRKKKEKKKANKQGGGDDDDFDAMLDEFKEAPPAATAEAAASSSAAPAPAAEKKAEEEDGEGEGEGDGEGPLDAKTLANRKKKEKKKAAQAKKVTGGEGMWGAADDQSPTAAAEGKAEAEAEAAADAPASSSAAPAAKGKAEPKKPAKKESAVVKAARERMEAERKLEEERLAFEAEQRRIIAEEEARIKAEEDRLEAERQRKRDNKLAKIQRMKEDGTYRTKKQKEYEKRAALLKEQFGFTNQDDEPDEEEEEGEGEKGEKKEEAKPAKGGKITKKEMIEKKKQLKLKQQAQADKEQESTEPPETKEEENPAPEPAKVEEEKKPQEDDDNDWEKLLDEPEAAEEDEGPKDAAKKTGGASDEEKEDEDETEEDNSSDDGSSDGSGSGSSSSSDLGYRSPIIVIMGHVDTGKTKLLDKIRRTNVQEGEAGGITQQIGATFFPSIALVEQTRKVDPEFDIEVPGIMIIDTPGHESFNNLRARGSSLCDMAILVIDIMHGLEPQTVESLEMLKKRRCPFLIALNKIDVCYQWNSEGYTSIRSALDRQEQFVRDEFQQRLGNVMLQLNERGLNVALYWENDDPRSTVSIVPTSALTGEGVPDLLFQMLNLTQTLMGAKLEVKEELQCTVIEVKNIEGLGTTIDVVLVNGTLREGDQIVLAGMGGPIVTTIRALLTPKPMKEMRVKGEYIHHAQISMSMGVKICAPGLDEAVAGTELLVVGPDDDIEELKEEVDEGFESVLAEFEKQAEGVYVKASTLGSLEALLSFLSDMKIPVFEVGIGEVHKKDVKKAAIMKEKKRPEYALILAFDVKVNKEALLEAKHEDVQIMTADIIYHLFDKFTAHMQKVQESKKTETRAEAVFPVILQIDKQYVFHKTDPMVFGCSVVGGQLRLGTPICVPEKENLAIGRVGGIEKDHKPIQIAKRGDVVCVKIEQNTAQTNIAYGRHFDYTNQLYSFITRSSIDTLKEHFKDEMGKADWELIIAMKKVFQIQ